MNKSILNEDVQTFIQAHIQDDISRLLFSKSPFTNISSREIAEQIESKKRCEKKLPLWFATPGIYYPPKLSIEQASSEATAKYKSHLIKGSTIIDLTGGFGVDSYFFSLKADQLTHSELNPELSNIAKHNSKALSACNIQFISGDGLEYLLKSPEKFDTLYVDPSRRVNAQKVFMLKDCEPDIVSNLDFLLKKASRLIIKTAPLLDIHSGLKELRHVSEIHVVSLKNECKELLWVIDRGFEGDPEIVCASIHGEVTQQYQFNPKNESEFTLDKYSEPLEFIYEPDVSLLKAGCFKLITRDFDVQKLHQHSHLYTSNFLKTDFIGRKFKLIKSWHYRAFIHDKPIKQANIICRNFPLTVEELKKKHRLEDGGNVYLLFTTGPEKELLALQCERLY